MRYITSISFALLAMICGCVYVESTVSTGITADQSASESGSEPATSLAPTTGTGSTGDASETTGASSTGDAASSMGDAGSSTSDGSSTGNGEADGGIIDACGFGEPCTDGVCAPNGECVAACRADGRCDMNELCLGGGCVDVGSDMMEAQVVAANDSPVGSVSAHDIDVWKIKLTHTGDYSVLISGSEITAYALNGAGEIVVDPSDAEMAGDFVSYDVSIDDSDLPMALLLMTSSPVPIAYYFFLIEN